MQPSSPCRWPRMATPSQITPSVCRSWPTTPATTPSSPCRTVTITTTATQRRSSLSRPTQPEIQKIIDFDRPPVDEQGLVLFFTGLSGSGKSTLARALMDQLLEQGTRTVTSLDGDVVRRNLSAGLSFSKADRETNIRRIGWVAAEISRHGGVAICSPIAPFDETRQQVRAMVEEAGGAFFLVHVATPLEECERRDRKGLYAKARRGEIPEFTGISSPYEEPADADVRVDTTGRSIDDALDDVIAVLAEDRRLPGRYRRSSTLAGRARRDPRMTPPPVRLHGQHLPVTLHGDVRAQRGERQRGCVQCWDLRPRRRAHELRDGDRARGARPDGRAASAADRSRATLVAESDLVDHRRARPPPVHPRRAPGRLPEGADPGAGGPGGPGGLASGSVGAEALPLLAEHRGAAEPDDDVADPFRRGPAAAAAAAEQITAMLDQFLPVLTSAEGKQHPWMT